MRFGLDVAQQQMSFDEIRRRVRLAEELGFDGAWGFDHLVPMYGHFEAGTGQRTGDCFEGMTTLAALAGATERIRLGLLVTGVTFRHPSLLAAQAVTIDHASGGRLELGLGAAWSEAEHRQFGMAFPPTAERFDMLEETLEIVDLLFRGEEVSYLGERFSLEGATLRPPPVQRPRPPIWIGGSGRHRTLPLVARWADVWHAFATSPERRERWVEASRALDALVERCGRDPSSVKRASTLSLSGPLDVVRREIDAQRALGIGYLVCSWPDEGGSRVEEVAEQILPELAGAADW